VRGFVAVARDALILISMMIKTPLGGLLGVEDLTHLLDVITLNGL